MSKTKEEIQKEIEEILEKNKDARNGFEKAAENADSKSLASYFRKKASRRGEFNSKLKSAVAKTYPDFDEDGSFGGSVHRVWMDIKNLFSADDDESMLEESIRGDKAAIEEYDDVIGYENLPRELELLLVSQREEIKRDISEHGSLKNIQ